MVGAFQRRGLRKAAEALGGEVRLRQFLGVSSTDLFRWMRGQAPVPEAVFRNVVDLLADIEAGIPLPGQQRITGSPDQPGPGST